MKKILKKTLVKEWIDTDGRTCQEWKREWTVVEDNPAPKKAAPEKVKKVEEPKKVEKAEEKKEE
jgi:hypothetical protein